MRLHWGGPILQSLFPPAQWAQLQSLQVDPTTLTKDEDTLQFINGQTGDSIAKFPANKFFRLRRSKLRTCLAQGLDIRFGKRLSDLTFSDKPAAWELRSKTEPNNPAI